MKIVEKIYSFLNWIFSHFTKKAVDNEPVETFTEDCSEEAEEEITVAQNEEKINVAKRTLLTELYIIEQEITVFENTLPKEYQAFMERIEMLREKYNSSLEELEKLLTFEIDPEIDSSKIGEVEKLKMDVKRFIEKEVEFDIISKRLQKLITKLNILYNVSILHSKESEIETISYRLGQALEAATSIAREFKDCYYILNDKQLKERIVSLFSYVDYEIFKTSVRTSDKTPDELIKNLVMANEFDGFDYTSSFKAFVKDELTDLGSLLELISDERFCKALRKTLQELLVQLTGSEDAENQIFNIGFWHNFLALESSLFEMLKLNGVEKEKIKVGLIVRMNINVDESDVLISPKTTAYLSLTSVYSATHDTKILLLMKLLQNISDEITYKEMYFLTLLFDALIVLENIPNKLTKHLEKYTKKYQYDSKSIMEKNEALSNSSLKEYVVAFTLNDNEEEIITTLEELNMDFRVEGDKVLMNSFYFGELKTVLDSLQAYTKNII